MINKFVCVFLLKSVYTATLLDCKCGTSSSATLRIFGGIETNENQYPWIVYIEFVKDKYCSGVLINNLYVLTSGHCVDKDTKLNFKIYLNTHNRLSSKPIKVYPIKIIRHENYQIEPTRNIINDISLIKLKSIINFNGNIYPSCLPHPESDHSRKMGKILGWGLNEEGSTSDILKEADIQVMSDDYCRRSMIGKYYHQSMICGYNKLSDACKGDSGGPLFYKNTDDQQELIGLISWGIKCGIGIPGIYTRITHFIDWIEENTQDAGYCNV